MKTTNKHESESTFSMRPVSHKSSRFSIVFDDDKSLSYGGLVLVDDLAKKLGLIDSCNSMVDLNGYPGGASPGRKVMTLIETLIVGGDCIDDANLLRSGASEKVLSHAVMAPSTLGSFLRCFTFGNVRQLDKLAGEMLKRAWSLGLGPNDEDITIDIDSTVCEVYGKKKEGSYYGYTKVLCQHPLLATLAGSGEALHIRHRKGSAHTGRGAERFTTETINRVRNAGATGNITLRADSGFYSQYVVQACDKKGVKYSITAKLAGPIKKAIESIEEDSWIPIDYTLNGEAQVGEANYKEGQRLIVRRTRITGDQADLFPNYRYHAFVTNCEGDKVELDAFHRNHATVELDIRDLKEGVGLNHMPSGRFNANGAWCVIATLAHNMMRWLSSIGESQTKRITAKSFRKKFIVFAARITKSARTFILHLPESWPYAKAWIKTLNALQLPQDST
ncbi:MAG: IS1380 family transposase [Thaumarchaeota archaeon]|nr:IS1380 family transposase [Nitrososphaerota archaeon]